MSKQPLVSLCMIVKNEEETLPRALTNWKALADELVIVDTGSTDHTVEVAQALDGRVLTYDWQYPGNKGAARNVGLEAAQGKWAVVLDADEIIANPAGLRGWLEKANQETAANVLFENYDNGNLTLKWYQVRVFKRELYRYIHREHELPHWAAATGQPNEVILHGVTFEHRSPADRQPGKMQPMMDRLMADVQEHPNTSGPMYFLHRQYLLNGQYQEAIEWGKRYIALESCVDPCEAYGNIATAHHLLGDTQEALRWLHKAAAEQSHRRIWWVRIAEMHMTQGRWQLGLAHLRLAAELWPEFEWQWEPDTNGTQLYHLIDKCQRALQSMHHTHSH